MPTGVLDQPEQRRWPAGIQPCDHPPGARVFEFDVIRAHQIRGGHIDQPVAQHVGAQQHLTLAALEAAEVNFVLGQDDSFRSELVNGLGADEHPTPAEPGHNPGDCRIVVRAAQSDDHVLDAANGLTGAGHDRRAQQLGEMDHRQPTAGLRRL